MNQSYLYAKLLREDMDEIKAAAATWRTYGDGDRIREAIRYEQGAIRKAIRQTRDELRRWQDHEMPALEAFYAQRLEIEVAHRDELNEGLREMGKVERAIERSNDRAIAQWRALQERDEQARRDFYGDDYVDPAATR